MSLDALEQDSEVSPDSDINIDKKDVKELVESIKEAQYFDANSMAPLTPASIVSTLPQWDNWKRI